MTNRDHPAQPRSRSSSSRRRRGERSFDIYSRLLNERDRLPRARDRRHDRQPRHRPAAPPGERGPGEGHQALHQLAGRLVTAGLAIYDTMQYIKCDVATICIGQCASMAAVLLAGGRRRQALRAAATAACSSTSRWGGTQGQVDRHRDRRKEMLRMRAAARRDPGASTPARPCEKIHADTDRDNIMTAEEAKAYGLVDERRRRSRKADVRRSSRVMARAHARKAPSTSSARSAARASARSASSSPGPGVYICDECIELCNDIVDEELAEERAERAVLDDLPTPREIYEALDELRRRPGATPRRCSSVAVYNHYKRITLHAGGRRRRRRARQEQHPAARPDRLRQDAARADARPHPEGAVRHRRRDHAHRGRLRRRGRREHPAQAHHRGRLRHRSAPRSASSTSTRSTRSRARPRTSRSRATCRARACSRRCSRSSRAPRPHVPPQGGRKHPQQELIKIDTTNILFILGGAFVGLEKIIARPHRQEGRRLRRRPHRRDASTRPGVLLAQVLPEDLHKFGLIPEFVGRLPVVAHVEELTEDDLVRILTEPKNALVKQYQRLFALEGVELDFTEDALRAIARAGDQARHRRARPALDHGDAAARHDVRPAGRDGRRARSS